MSTHLEPFYRKKSVWEYVSAVLHLPHKETKAEQIWHWLLRSLMSITLLVIGFLLGILYTMTSL